MGFGQDWIATTLVQYIPEDRNNAYLDRDIDTTAMLNNQNKVAGPVNEVWVVALVNELNAGANCKMDQVSMPIILKLYLRRIWIGIWCGRANQIKANWREGMMKWPIRRFYLNETIHVILHRRRIGKGGTQPSQPRIVNSIRLAGQNRKCTYTIRICFCNFQSVYVAACVSFHITPLWCDVLIVRLRYRCGQWLQGAYKNVSRT